MEGKLIENFKFRRIKYSCGSDILQNFGNISWFRITNVGFLLVVLQNICGVAMEFQERFWVTVREPCDLIIVQMSVHVSICTSYVFKALMPVVQKLWC
jgi:hypothetical protein